MIEKLDEVFRFHQEALNLRAQRQQILASNIANADTPQFQARDIDFAKALNNALDAGAKNSGPATLATTSARHLPGAVAAGAAPVLYRAPQQASIDGNTVEMDVERAQFADNAVHFEADLTVINNQLKTLLAAIQG